MTTIGAEGGAVKVTGIDVGKTRLDASAEGGPVRCFANDGPGIAALLGWLSAQGAELVVANPPADTKDPWCGACLVRGLGECGVPVHLAHPNRVRAFAPASGKPAKTDRLDAQILSRYGPVFALEGDPQREPEPATLPALLRRRRQLIDQRTQERNRLDRACNAGARASTQRHIAWLDEEIARLDQEYRDTLQSSAVLSQRSALYRSVPGVGELTAATLVAELPELGQGEGKGWCSLVGLAPWWVWRPGGFGALGSGQRATAGVSGHPWRTRRGASRPVHGGIGGGPARGRTAAVLPAPV